jgi:hypothetical protein
VPDKFLVVPVDGLIGDLAWEVTREGHEARYCIGNEEERQAQGRAPRRRAPGFPVSC